MKRKSRRSENKRSTAAETHSLPVRKNGIRYAGFLLTAVLLLGAGFLAGAAWEKRSRGKTLTVNGYTHTVLPVKAKSHTRRMPADFERKAALLLSARDLLEYHPQVFIHIVEAVWRNIKVVCIARNQAEVDEAKSLLQARGVPRQAVSYVKIDMNSMWIRDYGPLFVKDERGRNVILNADYMDVDEKGERWKDDDLPLALGEWFGVTVEEFPIEIEGGNLLGNGEGLVVTTTKVILRNEKKGYDVHKLFGLFNEKLGAKRWVYVEVLDGEQTGHADIFISFLAPNIVLVCDMDPEVDPVNAEKLDKAAMALSREMTSRGPLRVYRIPMPPPKEGVWRSYANAVLVNGIVLVPSYSDVDPELEAEALKLYKRLLPTWQVVSVKADSLVQNMGALHCISQQVPSGVSLKAILSADED